ncbi:MAG: DHH family phosphoesterase [Desulfovibrio sp.]|nr:DHH family phosphoesterase [Desulfovibrio sp.]
MKLQDLLDFRGAIAIQCHDNPDADALASGWGLFRYLESRGRSPLLFYGGRNRISKPNLVKMVDAFRIPVEHLPAMDRFDGLLVNVDCQFGAGNVQRVEAERSAVVDHHVQEKALPELCVFQPGVGSGSVLVWRLLADAGFPLAKDLQTALLYGLYTDTNGYSESRHPLDRDMRDALTDIDEDVFASLRLSNMSEEGVRLVGRALETLAIDRASRCATLDVEGCDPNVLGYISDLVLEVDGVDGVAVSSWQGDGGCKFSVRSAVRELPAPQLAQFIAEGMGSAGGHESKAGGWISGEKFRALQPGARMQDYMARRMRAFRETWRIVDCSRPETLPDVKGFESFRKLKLVRGAVFGEDLCPLPSKLRVRTLEGDLEMASAGAVVLFGVAGEVYAMGRERFEQTYDLLDGPYSRPEGPIKGYQPNVLDMGAGRLFSLEDLAGLAHACVSRDESLIRARRLGEGEHVLVFSRWDPRRPFAGGPGDWLACYGEGDFAVIGRDIFGRSYSKA